jgi:hypothetical protein
MRKSVGDLVDLWDFMELAQQRLEPLGLGNIPGNRKRRGYVDSAEGEVHGRPGIVTNKQGFVQWSDLGTSENGYGAGT